MVLSFRDSDRSTRPFLYRAICLSNMTSIRDFFQRFRRKYNAETIEAIREAQAHSRGEIELEPGYVPPGFSLKNASPKNKKYTVVQSSKFRSDLDRMIRRGADISELDAVVEILINGGNLPRRNKDHKLRGNYAGARECHINPDWLLIYSIDNEKVTLYELRTGTHSDLF